MPLYEYECSQCGHRFELIQRFSDPPADTCATCGQGPVHKLLSAPAVHFKGTGWYVTDYAKKTGASAVRTDAGPGDAPAGRVEGRRREETRRDRRREAAADDQARGGVNRSDQRQCDTSDSCYCFYSFNSSAGTP